MNGNLTDTLRFISSEATTTDLDRIIAALKLRRKALGAVRAASVTLGSKATLAAVGAPKYLNGLSGTVASIRGERADVALDMHSTATLREVGWRRYSIESDADTYLVRGVPLACLVTS